MWTDAPQLELTAPAGAQAIAVSVGVFVVLFVAFAWRRRRTTDGAPAGIGLRRLLIGVATTAAVGVAVVGGVRSFEAVSARFGSPLVPLTADGMIVACTALRIAALTRGWRIPGALATTYLFIGGTVWLNVAAAHDWSDAVAHALAPISYAILVEMLAHLLRLHLQLTTPPPLRRRVAGLTWATSPVVTTRVWLHLARTGGDDPAEARALVQQMVRLSSRLQAVCPRSRAWPFGPARQARSSALQVVRDGLLTAHDLAALLPVDGGRLAPALLLARVDTAALRCSTPDRTSATETPAPTAPVTPRTSTPATPRSGASGNTNGVAPSERLDPSSNGATSRAQRAVRRSDEDLVAELRAAGGPMSGRQVMRHLGVGWPKAKRLIELAGWTDPARASTANGQRANDPDRTEPAKANTTQDESTNRTETSRTP